MVAAMPPFLILKIKDVVILHKTQVQKAHKKQKTKCLLLALNPQHQIFLIKYALYPTKRRQKKQVKQTKLVLINDHKSLSRCLDFLIVRHIVKRPKTMIMPNTQRPPPVSAFKNFSGKTIPKIPMIINIRGVIRIMLFSPSVYLLFAANRLSYVIDF